jgi:hypothetical protein
MRRIEKVVSLPAGELLLVIDKDGNKNHVSIFYDSRLNVYFDKDGTIINIRENQVFDTGMIDDTFKISEAGKANIEKYYPADI